MTRFAMIEFRGEESLWAKLAAAAAPFGSLDFGDPSSAALIAAAIPGYLESGNPADVNAALAQAALRGSADAHAVVDTGYDPCSSACIIILRTPTSGTEIKIGPDGLVWVEFDPPSEDRAHQIILRAAEMNVSVSASPEHGRHLRPRHAWTARYERIALAARVAADQVVFAEDALHRAKAPA